MKRNGLPWRHSLLLIICTSLLWVLVDVIFLVLFVDNLSKCFIADSISKLNSNYDFLSQTSIPHLTNIRENYSVKERKQRILWKMRNATLKSLLRMVPNNSASEIRRVRIIPSSSETSKEGYGEMGKPVWLSEKFNDAREARFKENEFDVYVSELIALNRSIKDTRNSACARREYDWNLPKTSIIIVYHNEAWTTLLRNIYSIINRTPKELLSEIILVDDFSDRDNLKRPLDDYLQSLQHQVSIIVIRMSERSGLIKARVAGAARAKGPILTYLDAHCEVNIGWLEPLLAEIKKDRTHVVAPVIDIIDATNFAYISASDTKIGGFDWGLTFRWYDCPQREMERRNGDTSLPMRTPAIAGGLFSIDKDYFNYLGTYDTGMEVWGAENIEMSIRVWMCGGTLEIIPCSHVGHIFRAISPYTFPGGTNKVFYKNQRRLVEVWLDEWKAFYRIVMSDTLSYEPGNFSDRIELRKSLNCKSFKWFLETIFPEANMPQDLSSVYKIKTEKFDMCLDTVGRQGSNPVELYGCQLSFQQTFVYGKSGTITNNGLCLTLNKLNYKIVLTTCLEDSALQTWTYIESDHTIRQSDELTLCWNWISNKEKSKSFIHLLACDPYNNEQKWTFDRLIN